MRTATWTVEQLKAAVMDSRSVRQVLQHLGLVAAGGNYRHIQDVIEKNNIDSSHFLGRGWCKGRVTPIVKARPLSEILKKDSGYQSFKLKRRLFKEGLKEAHCETCGWAERTQDGHLPLELDHINGDGRDNRLENLRILCPNCHSLTPTYRSRKR